jgi:hypothetical protein
MGMSLDQSNSFEQQKFHFVEPKYISDLEQTGTDTDGRRQAMLTALIIHDASHWRSRSEALRKMADETDTFRPETRARMLRMARISMSSQCEPNSARRTSQPTP